MTDVDFRSRVAGTGEAPVVGRLGLLVFDERAREVLALTAAQIARGRKSLCHDGTPVGTASIAQDRSFIGGGRRATATMIEKIVVDPCVHILPRTIKLFRQDGLAHFTTCSSTEHFVGEKVLVHTDGGPRAALLRSASGYFRMPPPDLEEPVIFDTALVLDSLNQQPLTREGDAGLVVTSLAGEVLGIVVCGIGRTSFAAPLVPYLADHACHPLRQDEIYAWNRDADRAVQARDHSGPGQRQERGKDAATAEPLRALADAEDYTAIKTAGSHLRPYL